MEAAAGEGGGGAASKLVDKLTYVLGMHLRTGCFKDQPSVFPNLCLSLATCIDNAVASNEVPSKSHDIPLVLKQVYRYKNVCNLHAVLMVLMMSVKVACQIGWFLKTEKDDLLMMSKELGSCFSDTDSIHSEPTYANPCIEKIMSRFYPKMKMDRILVSFDVKPGYGAHVLDFHISKGMVAPERENMWLFVAGIDNLDTSSCIVSPPEVNFLVNTMGVPGRTKTNMHNGPQLPTNVTAMLKYGVNLLQAVGNFNGCYIIVIAVMSLVSSADAPPLQDYVEPVSTSVDSDCEVIEMSSRISLKCPISLRRLRTPVKGYRCKHLQCFDFNNFLTINSKRPLWRCPHCNQTVCFPDMRIDQKIAKVLSEVGENVVDVIISADGSWKPVLVNDEQSGQTSGNTPINHPKKLLQSEASGQTILTSTAAGNHLALDVNNLHQNPSSTLQCSAGSSIDHNLNRISSTAPLSTLGQSPVQTDLISQTHYESVGQTQAILTSTAPNNLHQNPSSTLQRSADSSIDDNLNRISSTAPLSILGQSPVQTDVIYQTHHESVGLTQAGFSSLQNQFNLYNSQHQQSDYASSVARNTHGMLPPGNSNRQLSEYPRARLPPPGYPQIPSLWENYRNLDPLMPTGASFAMSHTISSLPQYDTLNHGMDTQLQPSWFHANAPSVSPMLSYLRPHHSANQGTSGPAQNSGAHGMVFRPPSMQQNRHHPYRVNSYTPQVLSTLPNMAHAFVHALPQEVQIGVTPVYGTAQQGQSTTPSGPFQPTPSRTSSAYSLGTVSDWHRAAREQQQSNGGDGLAAMVSKNQCPSGRMRGSLRGEFATAYRQYILGPAQQAARASLPPTQVAANPGAAPIQTMAPNTTFTPIPNVSEGQSHLSSRYATGSSGSFPQQSRGVH